MHKIDMFDRPGMLDLEGSGADWLPQYKKYINDGKAIVTSLHKVYENDTNDLSLQLRKQGVDLVILSGMSINLRTESHMGELFELGFEVAALTNFRFTANAV